MYVNPVTQALDYKRMMQEQNLTQIELARKLGISRVRVTQYLNLLRLPKEQLDYIMQNGKEEKITERKLRKVTKPVKADLLDKTSSHQI